MDDGKDGIFIGRPTKWGNPYRVKDYGRTRAIELYESYLLNSKLLNDIDELKDKRLICFCYPLQCHGDVLLKFIYNK